MKLVGYQPSKIGGLWSGFPYYQFHMLPSLAGSFLSSSICWALNLAFQCCMPPTADPVQSTCPAWKTTGMLLTWAKAGDAKPWINLSLLRGLHIPCLLLFSQVDDKRVKAVLSVSNFCWLSGFNGQFMNAYIERKVLTPSGSQTWQ